MVILKRGENYILHPTSFSFFFLSFFQFLFLYPFSDKDRTALHRDLSGKSFTITIMACALVRISAGTLTVLTEAFRGFSDAI
jgi:hypothetical protein